MNATRNRFAKLAPALFLGLGAALCVLAVTADWLGVGGQPGFGWKQGLLLCLGLFASRLGWWLLRSPQSSERVFTLLVRWRDSVWGWWHSVWLRCRGPRQRLSRALAMLHLRATADIVPAEPNSWPSFKDGLLAFLLALVITAVDIFFSKRLGLLSYPPAYDGISYLLYAKADFCRLLHWPNFPSPPLNALGAPLWQGLMLLSFSVLGEGEWQAYTVRFWPAFLFLLLMLWVVRRRSSPYWAGVAALFTCLLPTLSVGLRATSREYFTGTLYSGPIGGSTWYLADLRPDLLFAALLVWAVVPLIEHVHRLDRRTWLVSGACAALAVLAKPSASPMLLLAWGSAVLYAFIANHRRLLATTVASLWALLTFTILLIPWVLLGGVSWTTAYLYRGLFTSQRAIYSVPEATLLSEATYYWKWYGTHMGSLEGWALLGAGLVVASFKPWKSKSKDNSLFAYLGIATALYILVTATPIKNFFLGLPYFFLLWLFSWAALVPSLTQLERRHRSSGVLLLLPCLYAIIIVGAGFYSLYHWPEERQRVGRENRETTSQIATDLHAVLRSEDSFMWVPAYGYPAALQYYMVDAHGAYPTACWFDPFTSPSPAEFVRETLGSCKAVLVYGQDIEGVSHVLYTPPVTYPYWRAIAGWVRQPNSGYSLTETYRLSDHTGGLIIVQLYVREAEPPRSESDR